MRLVLDPLAPNGYRLVRDEPAVINVASSSSSDAGSSNSGYRLTDNPDYTSTYVYVGYEHESNGSWYIYRRTLADNTRLYASGLSGYNWANRASEIYS